MTLSEHRQGLLFIVIGPPGSGKNTLMKYVLSHTDNLSQLATATTRPPRTGEQHGREHLFVDIPTFLHMIETGELLEWQKIHSKQHYYGIPRRVVEEAIQNGHDLIADIEVLGATYIRSRYPRNAVLVFIKPPTLEALAERMRNRGDSEEEIANRLKRVPTEMAFAPLCDHIIVNNLVDLAATELLEIVQQERARFMRGDTPPRITSFAAVVPIYDGEALLPNAPPAHLPLASGEIPHQAVLSYLQSHLSIPVSSDLLARPSESLFEGSFLPPSAIRIQEHSDAKTVLFTYVYLLPQRIPAPSGWSYVPFATAPLDPDVLAAVRALAEPTAGC